MFVPIYILTAVFQNMLSNIWPTFVINFISICQSDGRENITVLMSISVNTHEVELPEDIYCPYSPYFCGLPARGHGSFFSSAGSLFLGIIMRTQSFVSHWWFPVPGLLKHFAYSFSPHSRPAVLLMSPTNWNLKTVLCVPCFLVFTSSFTKIHSRIAIVCLLLAPNVLSLTWWIMKYDLCPLGEHWRENSPKNLC